ncbi:MAG: FHA domain-containing protein [Anaerolineae bacterium]|nr:FHA domain-containing protein [Anaerolineae bacterium]
MTNTRTTNKDKPILLVVDGPLRGQQWVIHRDELTLGRADNCDIVIPERSVSREHARIWRDDETYWVEDLGSKNGTHVNAVKLEGPRELSEGDEIQVALSVKLKFIGSDATVPLSIDEPVVSTSGLILDVHTRQVTIDGKILDPQLSLYQYRLLELLCEQSGGVCARDDVVHFVWPDAADVGISEQAIDALVRRLRDRLAELDPEHQYIATVRGHGFRFVQRGESVE